MLETITLGGNKSGCCCIYTSTGNRKTSKNCRVHYIVVKTLLRPNSSLRNCRVCGETMNGDFHLCSGYKDSDKRDILLVSKPKRREKTGENSVTGGSQCICEIDGRGLRVKLNMNCPTCTKV